MNLHQYQLFEASHDQATPNNLNHFQPTRQSRVSTAHW